MENETLIQSEPQETKPAIKYGWLRALLFLFASLIASSIGQAIALVLIALLFGIDFMEIFQDSSNIIKSLGVWIYFIVTLLGFYLCYLWYGYLENL